MDKKSETVIIHYPNGLEISFHRDDMFDYMFVINGCWFSRVMNKTVKTVEMTEDESEIWTEFVR